MGVDLGHSGYDPSRSYTQRVEVVLYPSQARKLEARGVELTEVDIAKPAGTKAERQAATGGDSPNPYYTVYRQFMEAGGIHDEMLQLAKQNRDVVDYQVIGRSRLGKPIAVLKVTADARHTPDNTRPAVLYSSNNHAREWIAAEVERRLMRWIIEHKNDAKIAELLSRTELWFMPIQNPDGYDHTFTCGSGPTNRLCGAGEPESNRFWRKTLRDNNADGIFGNAGDGVDPNRNYPAKRGIDEEGATNDPNGQTFRGPYALSEPENLAFDRLLRRIDRPRNFDNDPTQYQIKATHDIQPTRFDVSYGSTQDIEANVRRSLGPVDVTATISGPGGSSRTVTAIRATEVGPGERYGDAPGVFYKRVRVETPVNWASPTQAPRHATPGDTVAVTIRAGGLQQRFSYRVEAVPEGTAKRALVIAAEDYTGTSPNREAGYDGAPRYLAQHVDALEAAATRSRRSTSTPRRRVPPGSQARAIPRSSGSCRTSTPCCGTPGTTSSRRIRPRPTRGISAGRPPRLAHSGSRAGRTRR